MILKTRSESHSLAVLSTNSRATQIQLDIDSLRYLVRRVTYHSEIDVQIIGRYEDRLNQAMTIDDVQAIVDDLFSSVQSGQPSIESQTKVESPASTPLQELCSLGLERSDALVLKLAAEKVLAGRHNAEVISVPALVDDLHAEGLTHDDVADSVELLHKKGFIKAQGRHSRFFQLSTVGFDAYLRCFHESYVDDFEQICSAIVIDGLTNDLEIVQKLGLPRPFVSHVFDVLDMNQLCDVSRTSAGSTIYNVSVELRRKLREN